MPPFNMVSNIRSLAVPALLLLSAQAAAAEPIMIRSTVPYASDQVATSAIRQQCDWNSELPAALVARSNGEIVASDKELSTDTGRKLIMTVTSVHAAGGMFGGPKWAIVRGELFENGKLQGDFELRRVSSAGKITSCGSMDKIGSALANDILQWLKHPSLRAAAGADAKTP
jgi:hypothetical protein